MERRRVGCVYLGDTTNDARASLQAAVEAYLGGCEHLGALDGALAESGFDKFDDTWKMRDRITEDRIAVVH